MPIEFGQVLGMIGGSPILKAGKVIIEKLKAAKTTDPGGSGNVLQSLLKNGPSSILQNPMGAINSVMSGNITSAVSSLTGMSGASGLLSALGSGNPAQDLQAIGSATNLTDAMNSFKSLTGTMSGLTSAASGQVGLMDIIGHSNIVSGLTGGALPSNLNLSTVLAPLTMQTSIQSMANSVAQIATSVKNGTMTPAAGTTAVQGFVNQINGAMTGTVNAISTVQNLSQQIAHASMISVATSTTGYVDPTLSAVMQTLINPNGPLAPTATT